MLFRAQTPAVQATTARHQGSETLSEQHSAPHEAAKQVPSVYSRQYGDRPLLPFAVPIQRDRHGTQPSPEKGTQQPAKALVQGSLEAGQGQPGGRIDAVDVEEREQTEQRQVGGAEKGMRDVSEQGGAEEDHDGVEERREDEGQERRQERGLGSKELGC